MATPPLPDHLEALAIQVGQPPEAATGAISTPAFLTSTHVSPVLRQPLKPGAAAVVHFTTKYSNGHADVVGGVVRTSDAALHDRLRFLRNALGAVPSPMDCFPGGCAGPRRSSCAWSAMPRARASWRDVGCRRRDEPSRRTCCSTQT